MLFTSDFLKIKFAMSVPVAMIKPWGNKNFYVYFLIYTVSNDVMARILERFLQVILSIKCPIRSSYHCTSKRICVEFVYGMKWIKSQNYN